jgi:hypothetical protein
VRDQRDPITDWYPKTRDDDGAFSAIFTDRYRHRYLLLITADNDIVYEIKTQPRIATNLSSIILHFAFFIPCTVP